MWPGAQFEEHRPRLRAVAYRMLGSFAEADDAVQETWLRAAATDPATVDNPSGWLTTVAARVCLNILRTRQARREEPLEVHIPDPILGPKGGTDPEHEAVLADAVGLALLVVLDELAPAERVAFVLHDMFTVPFDEIAPMLDPAPGHADLGLRRFFSGCLRRRVAGLTAGPRDGCRGRPGRQLVAG